jgi:hypothetical protein
MASLSSASRTDRLEALPELLRLAADDLAREIVGLRGLGHRLPHVLKRHGDHLLAERRVERVQPVEAEETQHHPEGRALDEQGEEQEAGRQHGDEALGIRRR